MVVDDEEFSLMDLLVHSLNSSLGMSGVLEADITVILGIAVRSPLDLSGIDLTELGEENLELVIVGSLGEILDEEVVLLGRNFLFSSGLDLLLILLVVFENFKLLALEFLGVQGLNSGISLGDILKLDVSKTSALLAVGVGLELGGHNVTIGLEQVEDLLLSGVLLDVLD